MKHLITLVTILSISYGYTQVGIGTTSPNAQLEIAASNPANPTNSDGLIITRLNSLPTANPTVNQHGMLIQLLNTSGAKSPGFYYWDNTVPDWIPFVTGTSIGGYQDADWFEEGTLTAPDDINDSMFHIGNTAIGKNTATTQLDISETTDTNNSTLLVTRTNTSATAASAIKTAFTVAGNSAYGLENNLTGTANASVVGGVHNILNHSGSGEKRGLYNEFLAGSGPVTGVYNLISAPSTGVQNGLFTRFAGTNSAAHYGINIEFRGTGNGNNTGVYIDNAKNGSGVFHGALFEVGGNGNNTKYGVQNMISGSGSGDKYGTYNYVDSSAGGIHYGVYSAALKSTGYAGYFLGRVSIGTTSTNNYILPLSRGTDGQIMVTDGSGNVSWSNPSSVSSVQSISTVSSGTYNVTANDYTLRISNSVSSIVLPDPATVNGKILVLIGIPGISSKTISCLSGSLFDDATNSTITALAAGERYMIQSNGTNWYVIGN
ncbi:hypothetical protein NHF50_12905 [Flavobacterium sp. NRK F10]|uniref:hypothetical protein n=1 Tax=Flavobacterium sp. NRK F10 TaxID=2954931 RepID=UPI0020913776|nr:hypothetical protein [Flavobacterium sp. NRK F10]MCO6175944.1 hypothetical protein [Flavobacterium sp. NRK F10]